MSYNLSGVKSFNSLINARAHFGLGINDTVKVVCGIDPGTRHLAIKIGAVINNTRYIDVYTNLIDLGTKDKVMSNLTNWIKSIRHIWSIVQLVIIESQLRQNVPMARVESALASGISMYCGNDCQITTITTSNKDNYIKRATGATGRLTRPQLKTLACKLTKEYMIQVNDDTINRINSFKKKDDIADAYIYFLIGAESL